MKSSINQIGIAALNRLFTSKSYQGSANEVEVTVRKDDAPMWVHSFSHTNPLAYPNEDTTVTSKLTFMVWGIELGLKRLPDSNTAAMKTLAEAMLVEDWVCPSHFIKCETVEYSDGSACQVYYTIYRFSQAQEAAIVQLSKKALVS